MNCNPQEVLRGPIGPIGPQGKDGSLVEIQMSFTPNQIKEAHSIPIEVVAAPGHGFALAAEYCDVRRVRGSAPYTSLGLLITSQPSSAGQLITPTNFLTGAITTPYITKMTPTAVNINIVENTALYLQTGTADSGSGDDIITIWLSYRKISLT